MRLPNILAWIAGLSIAWGSSTAFAADEPPSRDAILRSMPRALPGVYRDDVTFSTAPLKPGKWQCTVSSNSKHEVCRQRRFSDRL
jgi:hypothetical protein